MRNLKRALSLGLASSMVLGTMAFGVSASQLEKFTDADKITNEKAVGIINQIGLMLGDDEGNFNPQGAVTRAEMAVICTTMLNGAGFHASQFVGTNVFTDVPEWCEDYVNLAASLGIVAGRGDGIFAPNDTVTTAEAMLMILKTLGYYDKDDTRLNSELIANWELSATRQGTSLNLYAPEIDGDLAADQPLTRENVASICFRALTDVAHVDYNPNQTAYYNYGGSMVNGVDNNSTADTLGYKYFKQLFAAETYDEFNRPSTTWMYDGQEIDTYTNTATHSFTEQKTAKDMYNTIGSTLLNASDSEYTRGIYINGELLTTGYELEVFKTDGTREVLDVETDTQEGFKSLMASNDTTPFLETGYGVLTEVFVTSPQYYTDGTIKVPGEIRVTLIHTYLGEIIDEEDLGDGVTKYHVDLYSKNALEIQQNAILSEGSVYTFETTETFGDNKVRVNLAGDGEKEYEIVIMEDVDVENGMATKSQLAPDVKGGSWLVIDGGEEMLYAHSVRGNISDTEAMAPVSNTEIDVYLDEYGYVLGYDAVIPPAQYLYIRDTGSYTLGGNKASVMFADGSNAIIEIAEIDDSTITNSLWNQLPKSNYFTDDEKNLYTANENYDYRGVNEEDGTLKDSDDGSGVVRSLQPRIYGYVELGDGTYRLLTDIQDRAYDYGVGNDLDEGVLPGITTQVDSADRWYYSQSVDHPELTGGDGIHFIDNQQENEIENRYSYVHSPEKDTMFIYTSVTYEAEKGTDGKIIYDENGLTNNIVTEQASDSDYTFLIRKNHSRVSMIGDGYQNKTTSESHVFAVDNSTVFIDVINGVSWTGFSNVPTMEDKDLNMQVLFGTGGVADAVFINNGQPAKDEGNFVLVLDNEATWENIDGTDYYTYTVWDMNQNKEVEIVSKNAELKDSTDGSKTKLNNNDVYKIYEEDEDEDGRTIVSTILRYYEVDDYANNAYFRNEANVRGPVTAVEYAAEGVILMAKDGDDSEYYAKDYDHAEASAFFNWDATTTTLGSSYEADGFTYNDDTQFIVLTANGEVAKDDSSKYSVRAGTVADIRDTSQTGRTWVDVVSASADKGDTHPIAEIVLVIKPYVTETADDTNFVNGLSDCPVKVWRMNNIKNTETGEYTFENGSGLSESDPARLAGYIDVNTLLDDAREFSGHSTRDIVYHIVRAYATGENNLGNEFGLEYDKDTVELSIVDYGTEYWVSDESKALEWIVKISGQVKTESGTYVDSEHYVSFYFGDQDYSGSWNPDTAIDKVHVVGLSDEVTLLSKLETAGIAGGGNVLLTKADSETLEDYLFDKLGAAGVGIKIKAGTVEFGEDTVVTFTYGDADVEYTFAVEKISEEVEFELGGTSYAGLNVDDVIKGLVGENGNYGVYGDGEETPYYLVWSADENLDKGNNGTTYLVLTADEADEYRDAPEVLAGAFVSSFLRPTVLTEEQITVARLAVGDFNEAGYTVFVQELDEDGELLEDENGKAVGTSYFVPVSSIDYTVDETPELDAAEKVLAAQNGVIYVVGSSVKDNVEAALDALINTKDLEATYTFNTAGDVVTITLVDKNGMEYETNLAIKEDTSAADTYTGTYTGLAVKDFDFETVIGNGTETAPIELKFKADANILLTMGEASVYEIDSAIFAQAIASSYAEKHEGLTVAKAYTLAVSSKSDEPWEISVEDAAGNKKYFEITFNGATIGESLTEAAVASIADDLNDNVLADLAFAVYDLEATISDIDDPEADRLIELAFTYIRDENTADADVIEDLKTVIALYASTLAAEDGGNTAVYGANDVMTAVSKSLGIYYIDVKVGLFTYRVQLDAENDTDIESIEDIEFASTAQVEAVATAENGVTEEDNVLLEDSETIAEYSVTDASIEVPTSGDIAGAFPGALVMTVKGDVTPQDDSSFNDGVNDLMIALAASAFENGDIRLVSVGDAATDLKDVRSTGNEETFFALAMYVNVSTNVKFEMVLNITMDVKASVSTITFDGNGGTLGADTSTVTTDAAGEIDTPADDPTRAGYDFGGWSRSSTGTTDESNGTFTSSCTLYAIWTPNFEETKGKLGVTLVLDTQTIEALTNKLAEVDAQNGNDPFYKSSLDTITLTKEDYLTAAVDDDVAANEVYALVKRTGWGGTETLKMKINVSGS